MLSQFICEEDGGLQGPRVPYLVPLPDKTDQEDKQLYRKRLILIWLASSLCVLAGLFMLLLVIYQEALVHHYSSFSNQSENKVQKIHSGNNSTLFSDYQWAVLVAGSKQWWNYRHQADVCHAYQVLKNGGLDVERMVVMMYDDIANSEYNPFPGKIYNRPYGPDVYEGVSKDYVGEQVTKENLFKAFGWGQHNDSTLKVLSPGISDRVFFYYTDHGGPGYIQMPNGDLIFADELRDLLINLYKNGAFGEMVIYLEACYAGSMFQGMLEDDIPIYVTTAANAEESSWACYCPGVRDDAAPPEFSTCLGDLYSVSWMENSESNDLSQESLKTQYQLVKQRTSQDFTYSMGSHVMQFGNMSIEEEVAGEYLGMENTGEKSQQHKLEATAPYMDLKLDQQFADLVPLIISYKMSKDEEQIAAHSQLLQALLKRQNMDHAVQESINALSLHLSHQNSEISDTLQSSLHQTDLFFTSAIGRSQDQPIVQDWDCYRKMVYTWQQKCGKLDSYGLKHGYVWLNLCNLGVEPDHYVQTLDQVCENGEIVARFGEDDVPHDTVDAFVNSYAYVNSYGYAAA